MRRAVIVLVPLCAVVAGSAAVGHQDGPVAAQSQRLGSAVTAVVVDVVVRDSKGNPVTNLRKDDFEVLEDGVRQEVGDVVAIGSSQAAVPRRDASSGGTPAPAPVSSSPDTDPNTRDDVAASHASPTFLALVFDRLSPEARALAYKGALASLDALRADDYIAVFLSDISLHTIQTYTNDREKLRKALKDVASRPTAVFDRLATRSIHHRESLGDTHPSVPAVASAEFTGRPAEIAAESGPVQADQAAMLEVTTRNLWELMARDQQGYATTNALLAVTSALGMLPGRKSVVFFAEGLAIPEAVLPHFRSVVTTANRGNVSVYTIDAAGLRVHSKDAETGREIRAMGNAGLTLGPDGASLSSLSMMERNEDVLRKDPRTSLTLLARDTGGFLVENTNDLAAAFRQIETDRRFVYLLTYTPTNADFDGKWRRITVRVPNREVSVRARSGYLAVRASGVLPLLAYEGPALAALGRSGRARAPADLPLRAGALVFPGAKATRVAVLAATDANALLFDSSHGSGTYRTDFAIVARVLDARGEVVRKSSQPYRLSGSIQQIEFAKRGEILFYRQPTLDAGTYTLEVALHDALAGRSSVHRSTVVVPKIEPAALQVSSLVLVRRAERVPPEHRDTTNPLYIGEVLIYPNLGEPIKKSHEKALTFVVVATNAGTSPGATIEIVENGRTISQGRVTLATANPSGRIEHIAQLPLDQLAPGRYTLRLTVSDGEFREVREAVFDVIE